MEQKEFGNNYDLNATWCFLKRWKTLLLIVLGAAFVVSLIASLLVTPRYKSTAILFPTSSNRLSKAILADRYSIDFMDYGIERDCEYAIQVLSSQSMEDDVCQRFNMLEHYGIDTNDSHKMFKLHEMYRSNVSVKRTEFLGVEVSVLDVDPQWAADIANFIAANYDTLSNRIQHARAKDAYEIMRGVSQDIQNDIFALDDSMALHPKHAAAFNELRTRKCKELAQIQTRMSETKVDLGSQISYKFWLDQATPADNKAYPKRAVIVLLGTLGALLLCILTLLIVGRFCKGDTPRKDRRTNGGAPRKKEENKRQTRVLAHETKTLPEQKKEAQPEQKKQNEPKTAPRKSPTPRKPAAVQQPKSSPQQPVHETTLPIADNRPRTDIAPNPPAPRIPKAPYNEAPNL
ncbi:MAG: hypothetical protein SPJ13_07560 [Bacteroidales bacterium]|nr:hypothetical protein [Bacteroidales bacterium]